MKTFTDFLYEDAGEKIRAMSDAQFADYKKSNPGAAAKADELRKKKRREQEQQKALPGAGKGGALATVPKSSGPSKPGALATRPADKGASIVRTKQSPASKEAFEKRNKMQKGYMTSPDGVTSSRIRPEPTKEEKKNPKKEEDKKKKDRFAGLRRRAGEAMARAGSEVEAGMDKEGKGLEGSKEIVRGERK